MADELRAVILQDGKTYSFTASNATIEDLVLWQLNIQSGLKTGVPKADSKQDLASMFLAMIVETSELLNNLNWKPWKAQHPINDEEVKGEWGDLFAFFLTITRMVAELTGVDAVDLVHHYISVTSKKNANRFAGSIAEYDVRKWITVHDNPAYEYSADMNPPTIREVATGRILSEEELMEWWRINYPNGLQSSF